MQWSANFNHEPGLTTSGSRKALFAKLALIVLGVYLLISCFMITFSRAGQTLLSPAKESKYRIAIHCSRKVLQLWRHTELIREYPIEIGKTGTHKRQSGDHKTPIGDYEISWMASRGAKKGHKIIDNKSWCFENKFVYAESGPSFEKLWADTYGGRQATVISLNYPNAKDSGRGFTGECIHIHADLRLREGALKKSYGCIHMFPRDAIELYDFVDVGVPVKILP